MAMTACRLSSWLSSWLLLALAASAASALVLTLQQRGVLLAYCRAWSVALVYFAAGMLRVLLCLASVHTHTSYPGADCHSAGMRVTVDNLHCCTNNTTLTPCWAIGFQRGLSSVLVEHQRRATYSTWLLLITTRALCQQPMISQ